MVKTLEQENITWVHRYKFPKNFKWWRKEQDFFDTATTDNGYFRGNYDWIRRTLEAIRDKYRCDPIQVIAYFYYQLEESSITLYSHSELSWVFQSQYSNADHLNRCLSETFWWELRLPWEITEKWRERLSRATSKQVAWVKEQTTRDLQRIFSIIQSKQKKESVQRVSYDALRSLRNNERRIAAILAHELDIPWEEYVWKAIGLGIMKFSKTKVANALNLFLESRWYTWIRVNKARVSDI